MNNVVSLTDHSLDRDQAEEIAGIFHLLGEPNRLAMVAGCLAGPRSVNELAVLAGTSPSLTSHHLRLLKAARLLRAERRGKFVYYSVHDHHVRRILTDMIEHVGEPPGEEKVDEDAGDEELD